MRCSELTTSDKYYDKYKRNKESRKFYCGSMWAKARELALKRDNYLCQSCLEKKIIRQAEVVHHKKELIDHPELATTLDNLVSWCNKCHTRHHKTRDKEKVIATNKIDVITVKTNEENF